jgi:hypothetical protein
MNHVPSSPVVSSASRRRLLCEGFFEKRGLGCVLSCPSQSLTSSPSSSPRTLDSHEALTFISQRNGLEPNRLMTQALSLPATYP